MEDQLIKYFIDESLYVLSSYIKIAAIVFILLYVVFKKSYWHRKIQQKMPKISDYFREVLLSLVAVTIFGIVSVLTFYVFWEETNAYGGRYDQYGKVYYYFTLIWMVFLHDAYFYWTHRLLHTKWLFKHVHKAHHLSTNTTPWTAYSVHPIEALVVAGIMPLIAFTLPVHSSAMIIFFVFQVAYNIYGHCGFELMPEGFHKNKLGRFVNTSVAHNQHHSHFNGNYSFYFLIWDRMFGTLRADYESTYQKTTIRTPEREFKSSPMKERKITRHEAA